MFKFKKDKLKYENAPAIWLEAKGTPLEFGRENYPAYDMPADDINAFINGYDPLDLFVRPSISSSKADYTTSAVNPDGWGALFANKEPSSRLSMVRPMSKTDEQIAYSDIPDEFKPLIKEAIYAHELAHFEDPRINTDKGTPWPYDKSERYKKELADLTKQYIKRGIDPKRADQVARRELPAMISEDKFWDRILS